MNLILKQRMVIKMWVKTQNDELVNLDGIINIWCQKINKEKFEITAVYTNYKDFITLGVYKHKEEAQDEINSIFKSISIGSLIYKI